MKNLKYFTIILLCLITTACINGQFRRTVYGNRNVVKKERTAGQFNSVKVSTGIDLYLTQGDNMSISVEADENLHEYIITEIKGDVLYIRHEDNINVREAERERVYVTMKDIKSLHTSSAGDIVGQTPIKTDNLELDASSAGDLYAYNLKAREADVSASSAGDADVFVTEKLTARASSAGDVNYKGDPKYIDAHASSAGGIHKK